MRAEKIEEEEEVPDEVAATEVGLPAKRPVPAWGWATAVAIIGACTAIIGYTIYQVWTQ
jgi:hypothetical protein